jgi:hypothetical protein
MPCGQPSKGIFHFVITYSEIRSINNSPLMAALTENKGPLLAFSIWLEANMKDAKTYREYAADCIRMAKLMGTKDKDALLKMAEAWEERAREAERQGKKTDR